MSVIFERINPITFLKLITTCQTTRELLIFLITGIIIFFVPSLLISQNSQSDSLSRKQEQPADSAKFRNIDEFTHNKTEESKTFEMKKSTWGALWRSLVLPGLGQIYVESYYKAPIFMGATGLLVYLIVDYNNKYDEKNGLVRTMEKEIPPSPDLSYQRSYREYYRDNRDMSAFYLLAVYVIAAVDAYVGAHLYDYNVSDKLTFGISPNNQGGLSCYISYRK